MKQTTKQYEVEGMTFFDFERAKSWATAYSLVYGVVPEIKVLVDIEEGREWIQ